MEEIKESLGFVVLGNMGQPMACNLLKAGYHLFGHGGDQWRTLKKVLAYYE